ncbi:uncharacterized protein [Arachis hypogaea]|uniref:uncharacterized protein isoform X5 n=1 Tax=Arachis hypogaea TaxID=3818 RepID=UPI0007894A53|nr:uncharacterized protein LOC112712490 isoform X5 [Arachis hypogaea]XP_025621177.1 uncharacterized protein LOC112712490 isoform X5 [Arachis hypogaea]
MGCIQRIKLDQLISVDNFPYLLWKHCYMFLYCFTISEAVTSRIFTGSYVLCSVAESKQLSYRTTAAEPKRKNSFVVALRALFGILGVFMLGTIVYTLVTDGSPFRMELLTPWMAATLVDFYINVVAISVWIAYKESSWINAAFWIILLICFGSAATSTYIVWQLFQISCQDPVYLILKANIRGFLMRHNSNGGYEQMFMQISLRIQLCKLQESYCFSKC